jgi:Domain of unknown function (DUF1905)
MTEIVAFEGELRSARGGGHAVSFDEALAASIGAKHMSRVTGTLDGAPFRSSVMRSGGGMFLGVHKATIHASGVAVGDTVRIEMSLDTEPREGDAPR